MYRFERPIIILSAPRSGSTLLFEVLSKSQSIWTIGGESHALIETIPSLNIAYRKFSSNALSEQDMNDNIREQLLQRFSDKVQNTQARRPDEDCSSKVRLLEKTPKNSLRVDFFNALFPDAIFIYLVRDPKENISSIMQAWRSNKFITYPSLPGWNRQNWSLLLPDRWQQLNDQPLQSIAAFQWQAANEAIINSLQQLDSSRWCMLTYEQLISNPAKTIKQLCEFTQTKFCESLVQLCREPLPYSRYTISTPKPEKWLENYHSIEQVWSKIASTLDKVNHHLSQHGHPIFEPQWQHRDVDNAIAPARVEATEQVKYDNVSRNSPCPCGSGKRFKQCHGALS